LLLSLSEAGIARGVVYPILGLGNGSEATSGLADTTMREKRSGLLLRVRHE